MNSQSRMAKTLGCLVAAMTTGTLVLHWLQPSAPAADDRYAIRLLSYELKQVVRPNANAPSVQWEGIVIRANTRNTNPDASHFQITSHGQLVQADNWRNQKVLTRSRQIEIAIEALSLSSSKASTPQDETIVALLNELRSEYMGGNGTIQIDEASFSKLDKLGKGAEYARHLKILLQGMSAG